MSMSNEFGICYCTSLIDLQRSILYPPIPISKELFSGERLAEHLLNIFPPDYNNSGKKANNLLTKNKQQ